MQSNWWRFAGSGNLWYNFNSLGMTGFDGAGWQ